MSNGSANRLTQATVERVPEQKNSALPEQNESSCVEKCSGIFQGKMRDSKRVSIIWSSLEHEFSIWSERFYEDASLLCALNCIFDDATVFKLRGNCFRGKKLETGSLQTSKELTVNPLLAPEE